MARVLIPYDGSPMAAAVVPRLRPWLERSKSSVVVLRVVDLQAAGAAAYPIDGVAAASILAEMEKEARRSVDELAATIAATGVEASGETAVGRPVSEILDAAERLAVDMLCLTTHGRTGLARWAFGSVTEKVLRRSPAPALVFPSFQRRGTERLPDERVLQPKRILLAVDDSDVGRTLTPVAISVARQFEAEVTALHVVPPGLGEIPRPLASYYLEAARAELGAGGVAAQTLLREGDAATEILDVAAGDAFQLVVMGTHGRTGWDRFTMGSVAERVLREAPCPVLVVHAKQR